MGKIMMNGNQYGVGGINTAEDVSYDNTSSGMTATNVQGALDELSNGLMPTTVPLSVDGRYMKGERATGTGFTVNIPLFYQPTSVSGTGLGYYTGSAWTNITIANWAWNGVVLIVEFGNPPSAAGFYGLRGTINITY